MSIPIFHQSRAYSVKVDKKIKLLGMPGYAHKRLVNLIVKYDKKYYLEEEKIFLQCPDEYLCEIGTLGNVNSGFSREKFGVGFLFRQLAKVASHFVFRGIGKVQLVLAAKPTSHFECVRKCYVEDVEALFDDDCQVLRLIYPFPLSLKRQLAYFAYLKRNNMAFRLAGLPYRLGDIIRLVRYRNYRSLQRMEAKAQLMHAIEHKVGAGITQVQCSEEYDFGSIYYSRYISRMGVSVHNVAHGVAKYLPYHSYTRFDVLTDSQKDFYEYFNNLKCCKRLLKKGSQKTIKVSRPSLVYLGQFSRNSPRIIEKYEKDILGVIGKVAKDFPGVDVYYKKHPNNESFAKGDCVDVKTIDAIVCAEFTDTIIQFSLYSTCQIDPNFMGYKFLVETPFVKPQILFGDTEPIVKIQDLYEFLRHKISLVVRESP